MGVNGSRCSVIFYLSEVQKYNSVTNFYVCIIFFCKVKVIIKFFSFSYPPFNLINMQAGRFGIHKHNFKNLVLKMSL